MTKKTNFALSVFLILFTMLGCEKDASTVKHTENLGDTPYQPDTIMVTYATNPERALNLLDSAAHLGNIDEYHEKLIRAIIYSMSLMVQNQDSAYTISEALLQHDSVTNNNENKAMVINLLINISRVKMNYYDYMRWTTEKAALCRERLQADSQLEAQSDMVELLRMEAEIGLAMTHLGQTKEGLTKIDKSIHQLDKPGSLDRMDAFIVASKRKINVLMELKRYEECIPVAKRMLDHLSYFEQHASNYAEDSKRLLWNGSTTERERYIDFSRAQAYGFIAITYARLGKTEEAHKFLELFDQSNYGHSFSARRMIIPAQMSLGMYNEAMNTCEQIVESMGTDTVNADYAIILRNRAIVARAEGRTAEAYNLMNRHALLSKELSDSLQKSGALDYAARYHAKEQQLKLQEAESNSQKKNIITIVIALLLVIAITASIYYKRQQQKIAKKNNALVRMINEAQQLTVMDDTEADDAEAEDASAEAQDEQNMESLGPEDANGLAQGSQSDNELFAFIDATIRSEHIYRNLNLQRQDVCNRFGISRTRLNNLLLQHRNNASLPQYINSIRMEEGVKLLRNRPDMSITAIAESVGFTLSNFRRQFTRNFGMTPYEYRQNL